MQVQVNAQEGLARELIISIPATDYEKKFDARIHDMSRRARIDGFRPGKVPTSVIKKRHGDEVRGEVISEIIRETYPKALSQENLNPAGMPEINDEPALDGDQLTYKALIEVYPEITLGDFSKLKATRPVAEVTDEDVTNMIEKLRQQRAQWVEVDRAAQEGDQVTIDFEGSIDGEVFEGGKGDNMDLILGSGRMIPGFEDEITGLKAGEEKTFKVKFPKDYHAEEMQGKKAEFAIKVNKVTEQKLPEIDEEFLKAYGVEDGREASLQTNLRDHMTRELSQNIKNYTKNELMEGLLEAHEVAVPNVLVKQEVEQLKRQALQNMGIDVEKQNIDLANFPDDGFREQAEKRVALGLILGEVIKQNDIKADADKTKAMIEEIAVGYDDPEQVVKYYYSNQQLLRNVEASVIEDQAFELLQEKAKIKDKDMSFDDVIAANQPSQ